MGCQIKDGYQFSNPSWVNQASKYDNMRKTHAETMDKHEDTIKACKAVTKCNWSEAAHLFYKATDIPQPSVSAKQGNYHIVFVLDESGSMVRSVFVHSNRPTHSYADTNTNTVEQKYIV